MPALALTDHGNLYGAIEFYSEATKAGIKPIIGYEAYISPGSRFERDGRGISEAAYHLTLLAKNHTGYKNLIKLASAAFLEGFYYRPRIDKELLEAHKEGIICLSGCLSSEFSYLILKDGFAEAKKLAEWYAGVFGEDFYIEVMNNGLNAQDICRDVAIDIAGESGLQVVATADTHYLCQEDAKAHDVLLCINTGKKVDDTDRMKMSNDQFFLRSPADMIDLFEADHVEVTLAVAEKCNVEIDFKTRHFPPFIPPEEKTHEQYLRELCLLGMGERYGPSVSDETLSRLERELEIICRMGFAGYFLVVHDFVRFARENDIPVSARGSACGSLVSYVLGLSIVDPIRFGLLFERFLDPSRMEPPDIDIDFCCERREEVLDYVRRKYGSDNVAQIVTFSTLAARAALRDVGRVLDVPIPRINQLVKLIPDEFEITLQGALDKSTDFKREYDSDPNAKRLIDLAMKLEGTNRNTGTHAAGVVIADKPLTEYLPLAKNGDTITTQWTMGDIEKVGLLKMDFLGLRNLTVLSKALAIIPVQIDIERLPLDDPETFKLIQAGETRGVFQLEADGVRGILTKMKPDCFDDIIAVNALNRPATLSEGMVDRYINVKHGQGRAVYEHPVMGAILDATNGVMVYQEQVMQILNRLGGIELSQAYTCIKSISKKKKDAIEKYRDQFITGAKTLGVTTAKANSIFELIIAFGGYGFNKSHSCAYAMIAYQTAYLKAHYPAEFMAALLSSELENSDRIAEHIADCRRMGIEIVPPDVNVGNVDFTVIDGKIHCSLAVIRGVSVRSVKAMVAARESRPFCGMFDFVERIDSSLLNKIGLESLIKAGAFDQFGARRSQYLNSIPRAMRYAEKRTKDHRRGQGGLFSEDLADVAESLSNVPDWMEIEKLAYEKHALGFYLTGQPFANYESVFQTYSSHQISQLEDVKSGEEVIVGGMISGVKYHSTRRPSRRGNSRMAKFVFEGLTGSAQCVMFPDDLIRQADIVVDDHICFVQAKVDHNYEKAGLIVQKIIPVNKAYEYLIRGVILKVDYSDNDPASLCKVYDNARQQYPGLGIELELQTLAGHKVKLKPKFAT